MSHQTAFVLDMVVLAFIPAMPIFLFITDRRYQWKKARVSPHLGVSREISTIDTNAPCRAALDVLPEDVHTAVLVSRCRDVEMSRCEGAYAMMLVWSHKPHESLPCAAGRDDDVRLR